MPAGVHPVDHFVYRELKARGLTPVALADRRTLVRRLYFDLTGLPPPPERVDAFAADDRPDAYDRLVDELLASPRYGERWARHWLDVVHYGETHGYDKDKPRPNAWPYRDYVIRSFNADKPYARFVREQVAGDRLFPGTLDGIVALGFLAAGPWDFIGHEELPESKIDGRVARHLDRDDFVATTVSTFLSLTAHCAQCHDHKFDPISQAEYYGLQAVFAAIDRTERDYDADPAVALARTELGRTRKEAESNLKRLDDLARTRAGNDFIEIERQVRDAQKPKGSLKPEYGYHSALSDRPNAVKWVQVDLGRPVAIDRIVLRPCTDDFNGIGAGFGFPVRYKVEVEDDAEFHKPVVIADRTDTDRPNSGVALVTVKAGGRTARFVRVTALKLAPRLATDFVFALAELEVLDRDGKNLALGASVSSHDSIEAPVRWRRSNLTDGHFPPASAPAASVAMLNAKRDALVTRSLDGDENAGRVSAVATLAAVRKEFESLPKPSGRAYVGAVHTGSGNFLGTGGKGGTPRPIHLLPRGDVTKPRAEIGPGALAVIPVKYELPPNASEADRRAALANWITHPENPLVWRSLVNRVWSYHFGRGLVDTPNDFGRMGQLPTHPELLDVLAAEFRDGGGSVKALHRRIVTSEAYRRSAASDPANEIMDAENRSLWRQTRRKLEAEAVRDSILFVAGTLDLKMGGPSYRDFVIEKPEHSPHYQYHLHDARDPKSHRRSVYRFVVRSKPQPFLAAFDCADPSQSVDKRNQTVTPQQALSLLNNPLTLVMAEAFAKRVDAMAPDRDGRVAAAFRLATARAPTKAEAEWLGKHAEDFGLASTCRLIFNLNEFSFVD